VSDEGGGAPSSSSCTDARSLCRDLSGASTMGPSSGPSSCADALGQWKAPGASTVRSQAPIFNAVRPPPYSFLFLFLYIYIGKWTTLLC